MIKQFQLVKEKIKTVLKKKKSQRELERTINRIEWRNVNRRR